MFRAFRSRWTVLAAAAIGATGGALAFGLIPGASAAPPPTTPGPAQPVSVQNTSTNPVPVSGTVGIDPANNGVAVTNFPANQTVNGTVNVGNLPASQTVKGTVGIDPQQNAVTSGDQTQVLFDNDYTIPPSGTADLGRFPVTAFRQVRLIVETDGSSQLVSIGEPVGARSVQFDLFNADGHGQTRTYDTPGLEFEINVLGPPGASGSMMLAGRNN